jgi:protocatechuate 3,4-dioxygenase beta subunit
MTRRRALQLVAAGGLAAVVGCGSSSRDSADTGAATADAATADAATPGAATTGARATAAVPEETAGPFPADGSNGVNVLTESGIVRRDLTTSFGTGSAVAEGVPLTIALTVLDVAAGGTPVQGAALYVWHCDREGRYSLYDPSLASENYLRGVQTSGADGALSFRSVWPGAYSGRWPHIHFEVYPSLGEATAAGSKLVTSQIALPDDACRQVYATAGYEVSAANLAGTSPASDMVFANGYSTQLARASGAPGEGMTIALNVGV